MRNIEQLITDQVNAWTKRESIYGAPTETPVHWPAVTISREFGARGAALAAVLGERMGFEVWDRDLLQAISRENNGDERLISSLDERRRSAIDDAVRDSLAGGKYSNTRYFRSLLRVVHTITSHGRCIIVGRGANYINKDPRGLNVRVVSPLAARIRNYAQRQGITEDEAAETY